MIVGKSHKNMNKAIKTWRLLYEDIKENLEINPQKKEKQIIKS